MRDLYSVDRKLVQSTSPRVMDRPTALTGALAHRRKQYHFGPSKISTHLACYRDIKISNSGV